MAKFVGDEGAPEWLNSAFMHALNLLVKRDVPNLKGTFGEDARIRVTSVSQHYEVEDCANMSIEFLYFPNGTGERNYDFEGTATEVEAEAEQIPMTDLKLLASGFRTAGGSVLIEETLHLLQSGTSCHPDLLRVLLKERKAAIALVLDEQATPDGWTPRLLANQVRKEIEAKGYGYPYHAALARERSD